MQLCFTNTFAQFYNSDKDAYKKFFQLTLVGNIPLFFMRAFSCQAITCSFSILTGSNCTCLLGKGIGRKVAQEMLVKLTSEVDFTNNFTCSS
jgi:hypothetical protein